MRDMLELGLNLENCELWLERAVFALVAVMFVVMIVRVSIMLYRLAPPPILTVVLVCSYIFSLQYPTTIPKLSDTPLAIITRILITTTLILTPTPSNAFSLFPIPSTMPWMQILRTGLLARRTRSWFMRQYPVARSRKSCKIKQQKRGFLRFLHQVIFITDTITVIQGIITTDTGALRRKELGESDCIPNPVRVCCRHTIPQV